MRKLLAIAALLLASTAAQAQYTFDYGGRTIRVDPDRGTVSIPGVYDNSGRKAKRSRNEDTDRSRSKQQAKTDSKQPAPIPRPLQPPLKRRRRRHRNRLPHLQPLLRSTSGPGG